jgi:hypothetical protein
VKDVVALNQTGVWEAKEREVPALSEFMRSRDCSVPEASSLSLSLEVQGGETYQRVSTL